MVARRNIKNLGKLIFVRVLFPSLLLFALLPTATFAEENTDNCLKLGADESFSGFHPLFEDLVASIYKRAGYCAVSIPLTPKRIQKMLGAGSLDSDWFRVEGYEDQFDLDLMAIPIPLFQIEAVLLYRTDSDFDGTPEDLQGRTVGYQSGFRWLEKGLPALGATPREIPTGVPVDELLMRGRFEIFATDSVRAHLTMQSQNDGKNTLRQTSWKKLSFFHLVHRRHQDKIEALKREIKRAMDAGEFDQIFALPGLSRVVTAED